MAVLTSIRNEFEVWHAGQMDGPMPPLATLESLRAKFRYARVNKAIWEQKPDYQEQVQQIISSHHGGRSSLSYKLFALLNKATAAVRTLLQSDAKERALCEAVKLTKVMADNDQWHGGTDAPDVAAGIVRRLGDVWARLLAVASLDPQDLSMLTAWLESIKQEWEGEGSAHLGTRMAFPFKVQLPSTPRKAAAQKSADELSSREKRKAGSSASTGQPPKKFVRVAPACADAEAWVHRFDRELAKRQASAVQLRCEAEGSVCCKRALVVSGAYPLRAVGLVIAEAFGKAVDDFDPHPNKGKPPPGLAFALPWDEKQPLKASLKIVQAIQEAGDSIIVRMDGLVVVVTCDAIKYKHDEGFKVIKDRPMPRCVGGDKSFTPQLMRRLNRVLFHNRKPIGFIGYSKKEAVNVTIEDMAKPIALQPGHPVVEGFGCGLTQPGEVDSSLLHPIVF